MNSMLYTNILLDGTYYFLRLYDLDNIIFI